MILVPAIPFYIVMGIGYYYFTMSIENSTMASMRRIVEDHRQMIDTFLRERKSDLEFVAESYTFDNLADPIYLYKAFNLLQNKSPAFVDLGVFNEEGIHVTYQGPYKLIGRDYGEEAWFKEVIRQVNYISDIFLGYRRVPHFIVAITREEPGRKWVLRSTIDTQFFTHLVERAGMAEAGAGAGREPRGGEEEPGGEEKRDRAGAGDLHVGSRAREVPPPAEAGRVRASERTVDQRPEAGEEELGAVPGGARSPPNRRHAAAPA